MKKSNVGGSKASHEILELLKEESPFSSGTPVLGNAIYFDSDQIIIGANAKKYFIETVRETEEYINIIPCNLLFEQNIKIDIQYSKPVYILFDKNRLDERGFIILK